MYVKVINCQMYSLQREIENWLAGLENNPKIEHTNLSSATRDFVTMVIFYTMP